MAEEAQYHHHDEPSNAADHMVVEATDRGLFDLAGKKEEEKKCDEGEVIASQFDHKVKIADHDDEDKKILHRSSSSTSSSSEEEVGEDGEKKKKKKKKKEIKKPNEKYDDKPTQEPDVEEKKGFLDKIKEKLPGGKKAEEVASPPPTPSTAAATTTEAEKKGLLEKIKDKIPGYNSKNIEEEKEKEASSY